MGFFLDGRSREQKIEDAKKLLQENGYVVRGPLLPKHAVQTPAQLVRFFYDVMAQYNPQFTMVYAGNVQKERAVAKRFIESRIDAGSSRERAIEECCELIILLFKYEKYLGLSFPITSMSVFGQESMGWLTERLWQIYVGINDEIEEAEDQRWFDEFYKEQEENVSKERLEAAKSRMDKVLKRNAKKEKGQDKGSNSLDS